MIENIISDSHEDKLRTCINKLRNVLNEMCYLIANIESSVARLAISRELGKLIIEYMIHSKNEVDIEENEENIKIYFVKQLI